ncbi:MAG TPA: FAD-dependent oxidoreductase [Clostridia bacterium]|nr:FAD-dependent oxidoreductase [Clostridia bacterium]
MNTKSLQKKLNKNFNGSVQAEIREGCIFVTGMLDNWEDIIIACQMSVDKKRKMHVVNDIELTGVKMPEMRVPSLKDNALEGEKPDVLIIGGGISGASIARELAKWKLNILLVDKEADLAMHASGRNDGEVHPGVDLSKGTLKQHYVKKGNAMYEKVCNELDVKFKRRGQYVGFCQKWLYPILAVFALQKKYVAGIRDTRLMSSKKLKKVEPELNPDFCFVLFNPSAGCVCPYGLTIGYAENAVMNGARVSLNTAVSNMEVEHGEIKSVLTNRGRIYPKIVINAAGVFAEEIAKMANDRFYSIHPRRGTNSILDKKAGHLINSIASIKKIEFSHSHTKGGGMLHTVDDNVLVGPDAVETYEKENTQTNAQSIQNVFEKQKNTAKGLSEKDIITYFTGVRAPTFEEDFIIEKGRKTKNLIHCAGIQSPGLTTAPAVALDIEKMAVEMLGESVKVARNKDFNPIRKGIPSLKDMSPPKRAEMIAKNSDYGVIVCRCEEISKGEIIDALNSPICVPTVDGVKKRVRAGMGRCQGGFCSPLVTKIISEHFDIPLSQVRKSSEGSVITFGETKGGY